MLQTLLTGLKQLMYALSQYGSKTHARAGVPAAPQQVGIQQPGVVKTPWRQACLQGKAECDL